MCTSQRSGSRAGIQTVNGASCDGPLDREAAPHAGLGGGRADLLAGRRRERERLVAELLVERDRLHLEDRERLTLEAALDMQQRSALAVDVEQQLVGAWEAESPQSEVVPVAADRPDVPNGAARAAARDDVRVVEHTDRRGGIEQPGELVADDVAGFRVVLVRERAVIGVVAPPEAPALDGDRLALRVLALFARVVGRRQPHAHETLRRLGLGALGDHVHGRARKALHGLAAATQVPPRAHGGPHRGDPCAGAVHQFEQVAELAHVRMIA
jgi:hypothetical protein